MADVQAPLPVPPPIPSSATTSNESSTLPVAAISESLPQPPAALAAPESLPPPQPQPQAVQHEGDITHPALPVPVPDHAPATHETAIAPTVQLPEEDGRRDAENTTPTPTGDNDADTDAITGGESEIGVVANNQDDNESDEGTASSTTDGSEAELAGDLTGAELNSLRGILSLVATVLAEDINGVNVPDNEAPSGQSDDDEPLLPFCDEDEVDLGPSFNGTYTVHKPSFEQHLPFAEVEDEDEFRELHNGNLVGFFELISGNEFYRNYVRGNTLRKLRTSKDALKGKPGVLKGFLQLPSEILFDVMERFHPIDLLQLSRTSKALRSLVLNRDCERVWKSAYSAHEIDLPLPPDEYPAPKWTAMMYDDAICDFCGSEAALLDFALEQHYCDRCQTKYLVDQNDLSSVIAELPSRVTDYVFQLVPYTYRQSGGKYLTYYESENNARYRRTEVMDMIETLQTWYMTIDEGVFPDAGEKFEKWRDELIERMQKLSENAQTYNNWATSYYYTLCTEVTMLQRSLADKIVAKYAKRGYDARDTEAASGDVFYVFREAEVERITPKVLRTLNEEIVSKIESSQRERMRRERRTVVDKFYLDYKRRVKPEEWAQLPPSDVIAYSSFFQEYINQDSLDMGEALKTDEGIAKVPEIADEWYFNRQQELYECLPGVDPLPSDDPELDVSDEEREKMTEEEQEARLEVLRKERRVEQRKMMLARLRRAKSVFACTSCRAGRHSGIAVIGWDDACVHMCGSYGMYYHMGWEFCSVGYAAAGALIERVGLDGETATPEDMDKVNARFFCGNCPVKTRGKVQGRKALTWRECVSHAVEKEEDHTHAIPAWLLLAPEARAFTLAHERPWPSPQTKNWSCNHCPEHLEAGLPLKAALAHVKEKHTAVANPVKGVDVIFLKGQYERRGLSRRRPIFQYGIEPTANLRCELCGYGSVRKMWTIQALVPHLFHKHGISMPKSTRDYSRIEVLAP